MAEQQGPVGQLGVMSEWSHSDPQFHNPQDGPQPIDAHDQKIADSRQRLRARNNRGASGPDGSVGFQGVAGANTNIAPQPSIQTQVQLGERNLLNEGRTKDGKPYPDRGDTFVGALGRAQDSNVNDTIGAQSIMGMPRDNSSMLTPLGELKSMPQRKGEEAGGKETKQHTPDDITRLLHMYHVPMSQETVNSMAEEDGSVHPDKMKAIEEYVKNVAQGLFPTLAPQIKAGIPTAYLVDPYRHVAKMLLGEHVEPDFIGDPKWGMALTGGQDKDGRRIPMGLDEWKQHMMKSRDYGYQNTEAAHRHAERVAAALHEAFGGQ